jgi:DNA-binding CsgD family transcriptional regulator
VPDAGTKLHLDFDSHELRQAIFGTLYESESVGFGLCDSNLRVVFINTAWPKMDGVAPADHLGKTIPEILGAQACPVEAAMRRVLGTGEKIEGLKFGAKIPAVAEAAEWLVNLYPVKVAGEPYVCSLTINTTAKTGFDAYLTVRSSDRTLFSPRPEPTRTQAPLLTERETQVAHLLAEGKSNKEIGVCLKISTKTVEFYRSQIFRKLRVHSMAELVLFAVREHIINV